MKYRAEIDGLRAVAVIPVILFHAGLALFSGGYVGVDVFFVISGYLITTIIVDEQHAGRFSLAAFYERRARRILPALFLVVLACVPFAWVLLTPDELRSFAKSVISVSTFTSNFHFYGESGYFDTDAELKPLLHTWSLAVEEQYYILFPPLLMLLFRRARFLVVPAIVLLALGSLVLSEVGARSNSSAAFFLLPARAWELLAGSLCALYLRRTANPLQSYPHVQTLLAAVGLALIVASMVMIDDGTSFPGLSVLPVVAGTALLICFARGDNAIGRLLAWRPMVAIGLISYSAYLWHQPIFAFARHASAKEPSQLMMLLLAALGLVLAWLSWRYVEAPFRDKQRFSRRRIWQVSGYGLLLMLGLGAVGHATRGLPQRLNEVEQQIYAVSREKNPDSKLKLCSQYRPERGLQHAACVPAGEYRARVLVTGDSHANALVRALNEALTPLDVAVTQLTHRGCYPIGGVSPSGRRDSCVRFNEALLEYVDGNAVEDVIVLSGRWSLAFEGERFDNGEGGVEKGRNSGVRPVGADRDMDEQLRRAAVTDAIRTHLAHLLASGKHVVLVYPVPEAGWHVPNYMLKHGRGRYDDPAFASTSAARFQERAGPVMSVLDSIPDHPRLHRVKPHTWLCDNDVPGRCITQRQGSPIYKDDDHLSLAGTRDIAQRIRDIVTSVLAEQDLPRSTDMGDEDGQ